MEMLYFGQLVPGSPFIAKAWDASKVNVSNISPGRIGKPSYFKSKILTVLLTYVSIYYSASHTPHALLKQ